MVSAMATLLLIQKVKVEIVMWQEMVDLRRCDPLNAHGLAGHLLIILADRLLYVI